VSFNGTSVGLDVHAPPWVWKIGRHLTFVGAQGCWIWSLIATAVVRECRVHCGGEWPVLCEYFDVPRSVGGVPLWVITRAVAA
jgi:hypothetical protein